VSTSQPFTASPSQSANPAAHESMWHEPPTHDVLALAPLQARPQRPQFIGSVATAASHPSTMLSLQFSKPNRHVFVQLPAMHTV
jgi:hypothetical protein